MKVASVPEGWGERIDDLVARGQSSRAIELLEVWVTQFVFTPWAMQRLGELYLEVGHRDKVGQAFFWSGIRGDPDRQDCIDGWLKSRRCSPRRIVDSLSQRARLPIGSMPGELPGELAALKVTDSIATRQNRSNNKFVDALLIAALVWIMGVGAVMTFLWIKRGVAWLFG